MSGLALLVPDMSDVEYHQHPALSSSGAKKLLPPSCPALFKYERDHGQAPKDVFDFGRAAHAEVLGVGGELVVVEADNWMTKAAKAQREEARAEGKTALLAHEAEQVRGMAQALAAHPIASALFDPDRGAAEQSVFWHDERFGVDRRARFDWLPDAGSGRLVIGDYKSAASAEPGAIAKAVANFGYALQDAFYTDAARALGHEDPAFLFAFQAKTPPYLVTVVELDAAAKAHGARQVARALEVFAECSATDTWPAYTDGIELITLPVWATRDSEVYA